MTSAELDLKSAMIQYVANENKAHFKSQQIEDPELSLNDRICVLEEILGKSHAIFLSRFGAFLNPQHLKYFEQQDYHPEEKYEIQHYLEELKNMHTRFDVTVRNRRYDALQKLITEGNYFSEIEMMKREPLLYEQLVGQYLTDKEIRERDKIGGEPASFLNVLLDGIEKDHVTDLKKKQQQEEEGDDGDADVEEDDDDDNTSDSNKNISRSFSCGHPDSDDDKFPKIPPSFRKKWGEFEDPVPATSSATKSAATKIDDDKIKRVTVAERTLLRDEFFSIMYSKFLSGFDKNFDYTKVDTKSDFDNIDIKAQDDEDKYFDEEEETAIPPRIQYDDDTKDGSDDELEVYMKTLRDGDKGAIPN